MREKRTYHVSFCVRDYYCIRLTASSEDEALEKAENLYNEEHEDAFELDITLGGTDDWQAEEVRS